MKIAHIVESSATGTLSMLCLIANRLARDGHDVHVIYSDRIRRPVLPRCSTRACRCATSR